MGRPKGSKNKKVKVGHVKVVPTKIVIADKLVEGENPEPEKITTDTVLCKLCGHDDSLHYGGEKLQCNTQGCQCRELK